MKIENNFENDINNISQEINSENILNVDFGNQQKLIIRNNKFENIHKRIKNQTKVIIMIRGENLLIKTLLVCSLLVHFVFKLNQSKYNTNSSKIYNKRIYPPNQTKNQIITIGFYDFISCDRKWRRVKKGYFYDLPKYSLFCTIFSKK